MTKEKKSEGFTLDSPAIAGLPVINAIMDRLALPELLATTLPAVDGRTKVAPAQLVRLIVANLVLGREPLYGLGEWAARFDPGLLGLEPEQVPAINDDRAGRALDALFDADRASLLNTLVLKAVGEYGIDTTQMHNDSTSISVHGAYHDADGTPRGGKPTPVITFGHSKDHRPDLKQLVWILTVSSDGAVPMAYRLADGNTSDDPTHVPTWDALVALLGKKDFLYVADSKLCSRTAMDHITGHGGRFVTVLPRTRSEDQAFRSHLQTHVPDWVQATSKPGRHLGDPDDLYSVVEAPTPSKEGHRIIWVHSTAKAARDGHYRQTRTEAGITAIEALEAKLAGPRSRIKTRLAAEKAAAMALAEARAARWVTATITETQEKTYQQDGRGRPGPDTRYKETTTSRFSVTANSNLENIAYDAATDGCFPLITNDRDLSNAEVLAAYKYQPNLERRHHLLKSVQDAAPVLLRNPARIEALFCCQFLALLISALIEREVRNGMHEAGKRKISLYPEFRACTAPSTERILEILGPLQRNTLRQQGTLIQVFEPDLTDQQHQILELMGLDPAIYTKQK